MKAHFDPFGSKTMSSGQFPYPIPACLSRKDEKLIKKAARRERHRMLYLSPGQKTPVLEFYEQRCQLGQREVYNQRFKHVYPLTDVVARANNVLSRELDVGSEPPETGLSRQEWFNVRRAQEEIVRAQASLTLIDYLANLAIDEWNGFYSALLGMHLDFAIGTSNHPTLLSHKTSLTNALPPLGTLEPPAGAIKELEQNPYNNTDNRNNDK